MNNLFAGLSALTPSSGSGTSTPSAETPQDIPKEELMNLCMKMNKRMQAMETKGKELVKKKSVLLSERQKLLDLLRSVIPVPILSKEDSDLDLVVIEQSWQQFESQRREHNSELEDRVTAREQLMQQSLRAMEEQYKKIIHDLKVHQSAELNSVQTKVVVEGRDPLSEPTAVVDSAANAAAAAQQEQDSSIAAIVEAEREKMMAQAALQELQKRVTKADAEVERLKGVEVYLKQQLSTMEGVITSKNQELEGLQRDLEASKTTYEEKIVYLQMQLTSSKGKDESRDKESITHKATVDKLTAQISALQRLIEEKDLSYKSNKDMIVALQARLIELEPELAQNREKIAQHERNLSAQSMLKAEQGALTNSLRADLKASLDELDTARRRNKDLEEFKVKAEGQLLKLTSLGEQVHSLQSALEDKDSLITRLRAEQQVSERNHAMRTAMLATCEAQLETVTQELQSRDATTQEAIERVTSLQTALAACESRLAERVREAAAEIAALENKIVDINQDRELALSSLEKIQDEALETQKRDHARKSAMARTLLSEREEEVRVLSAKVQELQEEISSGAPTERKFFELALSQSKRESLHGVHNDTREIAFAQVQSKLAAKDLELARVQQVLAGLQAEVVDLRRTRQREGINMDYLKNVVIQYMTFPAQSSEKMSLVPVLAMLLQFTPKEMCAVQRCALVETPQSSSLWSSLGLSSAGAAPAYGSSRTPKEVKRPTAAVIGSPAGASAAAAGAGRGAVYSSPPPAAPQAASSAGKNTPNAAAPVTRTPSSGGVSSATLTAAALAQNSLTQHARSPPASTAQGQGSTGPTPSRHVSSSSQTPSATQDTSNDAAGGYQPPSITTTTYEGIPLSPSTSNSDVSGYSPPKLDSTQRQLAPQGVVDVNASHKSAIMEESHTDNGVSADPNFDTPVKKDPVRRAFGSPGSFKNKSDSAAKKNSMNRMLAYRTSSMNNSEYEFQQKLRSIGSDILSLDNSMSYDDGDIDATYVDVEDAVLEDVAEGDEVDDGLDGTSV